MADWLQKPNRVYKFGNYLNVVHLNDYKTTDSVWFPLAIYDEIMSTDSASRTQFDSNLLFCSNRILNY